MFQRIGSGLKKRTTAINEQAGVQRKITIVVQEIYRSFGLSPGNTPSVSYDRDQNTITIQTTSKVVASEFLLRMTELRSLLRQEGVIPTTITIH